MTVGGHTDGYSSLYTAAPNATTEERQWAVEMFLDFALGHPDVRIVPMGEIIEWMRAPVAL